MMSKKTELPEVDIVEMEEVELKAPHVILGFVGAGLVGGIAVTHVIDELKMKPIANIRSRYMPSSVIFIDGKLRHPFRIYSTEDGGLCAIVCEVPLLSDGYYPIAARLLDWVEEKGAKEVAVLEGVAVRNIPKKRGGLWELFDYFSDFGVWEGFKSRGSDITLTSNC